MIGLPVEASAKMVVDMNTLLSSFQVYYQNLRGIHWNIKGKRFFNLHVKFEELYTDAQIKIDEIAERILSIGGTPLHTFEDYLQCNKVIVGKNVSNDEKAVNLIVESLSQLLQLERDILVKANEITDEGTSAMMSDLIKEQEKTVWMMNAWLGESL